MSYSVEDAINLGLIYVIFEGDSQVAFEATEQKKKSCFWKLLSKLGSSSCPWEISNLLKDMHGNHYQLEERCLLPMD